MDEILHELKEQYMFALQEYLAGKGENALGHAYELGRKAIASRLGILDIVAVHQEALITVLLRTQTQEESSDIAKKTAEFFAESMAPFEMTFRGFQESIMRLHILNKTLEKSENKFRSVVQAANEAIILVDSSENIISWNKGAETIFGYPEKEVLGKSLTILIPERYRDGHEKELEMYKSTDEYTGKIFEFHGLRKDGSEFFMELSVAIWETEEGTFYTYIIRDITDRKLAEGKIREQANLLDKAHDAIAVRDMNHCLIYWNKGAQRLYGWTAEEAIGKSADKLLYKEESSALIEAKKSVIEKGEWTGELHQVTKEGKKVIAESRWTLVRDSEDKPVSILIINTDITDKKRLESQLLRAQRMESIGTLAGGIAHDLNNVLTPIMLSLQMLKQKLPDEQSQKLINILETNSQRGANLIKQVLSFARGVEGERNPLQIRHIVSEIERIAKETFPRDIEIRIDIPKDLWTISGDATQLHQVIMNLCVNARDAMPYGGKLSIIASNVIIDENYVHMLNEAKVGPYASIAVSDTGCGIPPEILDRIFEPFFTTKEHGKGTGLGLSTAHAIVKSHGGYINVYSEVEKGTTFRIYLPAIETEIQTTAEQQLELPAGNGELILIAEDEEPISEITRSTLEAYGYNVLTATDGAEAVALYAQNIDKIKAVLMDMMMPVMDGQESIQVIRRINPRVKIIAVSGLAEKDRLEKIADANVHAFLPKPYTTDILLKIVHQVVSAE